MDINFHYRQQGLLVDGSGISFFKKKKKPSTQVHLLDFRFYRDKTQFTLILVQFSFISFSILKLNHIFVSDSNNKKYQMIIYKYTSQKLSIWKPTIIRICESSFYNKQLTIKSLFKLVHNVLFDMFLHFYLQEIY